MLSSLGSRTLSCWYLSNCPLWRSPFPSRLWRLSGHCRCRFSSHLGAGALEHPFCPWFVVVLLSPPCCWGCSWGSWQSPQLDLPPLCFLPSTVRWRLSPPTPELLGTALNFCCSVRLSRDRAESKCLTGPANPADLSVPGRTGLLRAFPYPCFGRPTVQWRVNKVSDLLFTNTAN